MNPPLSERGLSTKSFAVPTRTWTSSTAQENFTKAILKQKQIKQFPY